MAIEHADFEGVERLAAVTGGATASTFDHPELAVLGECKKIEEVGGAAPLVVVFVRGGGRGRCVCLGEAVLLASRVYFRVIRNRRNVSFIRSTV